LALWSDSEALAIFEVFCYCGEGQDWKFTDDVTLASQAESKFISTAHLKCL